MQSINPITVIKASGIKEPFSEEKVIRSLAKTGLSQDLTSRTVDHLKHQLKHEVTTDAIYNNVSTYLKKNEYTENFFYYGLKRAVMALGPSGHPLEFLVSDLLRSHNYKTEVGVVTQGKCVTHEIDVIAQKEDKKYFIECKYHNAPGTKIDIQVALYSYARFLDINDAQKKNGNVNNYPWLITNTKATTEVLNYGKCTGLKVTTWALPQGESLQDLIVTSGLHPITILYGISKNKIDALLARGIVTCARLNTAILNNEVSDILDENDTPAILSKIAIICKK
ncbi:MAG TPA: ATP cone domain-containing protein [Spirochaetia bacterium]|nr:ATP cone domain-containing protein [Spirochaetia bacterium]